MAETKTFLSHAGLQHYDAKIKEFIKSQGPDVTNKLIALIGAAEKGADQKTILARIADLERVVGNISELPEYQNLVAAILGESNRAKAAEKGLGDHLNVIEGEGEGSIKKALSDAKAYADGKDAAIAEAKKAGTDAQTAVNSLAGKVGTVADGKTVVGMIETAQSAAATAQSEIDALEVKVGEVPSDKTIIQMIAEAKTEATYDDTQIKADIAANKSAIDAVKADYLKASDKTELTNTINTNKSILDKVKEDVDAFFANADLTAQAKDTLKEIQEYINSDATAAAEMTASIQSNSSAISALNTKVGTIPEDATATDVVGYIDEKVATEGTRTDNAIKTAVEALDADLAQEAGADGLALSITEVDGKITAISGSITANTYDAHGAAKAVQGATTKTVKELEDDLAAIGAISDSQIDALFATVQA